PTQTMALPAGSPAIGKGAVISGLTTDQRGAPVGSVVDIGAFQTSLVVKSTSGSVVTTAAGMTLPGAVSVANQFPGMAITFDPTVFVTPATITLGGTSLVLSNPILTTSITGPATQLAISGNNASRVFQITGASLTLANLKIVSGLAQDDGTGAAAGTTT